MNDINVIKTNETNYFTMEIADYKSAACSFVFIATYSWVFAWFV